MRIGRRYYSEIRSLLCSRLERRSHFYCVHLLERIVMWLLMERHDAGVVHRNRRRIDRALETIRMQAVADALAHKEA